MPQLYDDPAVVKTLPYAKELRTAVENATSRPVSPVYSQISQAVFTNVNKAIGGQMSPEDALKKRPGADRDGALQLLMAPVELLIAGGGSRGATFAGWAARHPERARVVAVAEPREDRREALADAHGVHPDLRFADWREAVGRRRPVADAAIVATLDREHTEPAIALAGQGYALLIEKPLATTEAECVAIAEATERAGVVAAVAHVLRYTPYTRLVRRLLDEGAVGEVVSVEHLEPVGFFHHAHSYVRGNWRREDEAGPMLLAKCCHDLDWLSHVVGRRAVAVSSFGSLVAPAARAPARGRRRPLPGLRDRARLRVLGAQDLPRAGRAGRDRLAGRRRRLAADARARRGGAARRALRPLRVGLRQRRRRPPGRLAGLRGRRDREPDDDRLHRDARPRDADLRHPRASCAATASPPRSTTS